MTRLIVVLPAFAMLLSASARAEVSPVVLEAEQFGQVVACLDDVVDDYDLDRLSHLA